LKILKVRSLADQAITIELDNQPGARAAKRVQNALNAITTARQDGKLTDVTEAAGAFASVTLYYNCLKTSQNKLIEKVKEILTDVDLTTNQDGQLWELPCCYEEVYGIDLESVASDTGLKQAEIIRIHSEVTFSVYAMGFLPGLPFMGDLPDVLALPRRNVPRTKVPAGSVAIAKGLSVIYPCSSPGGWHILGHCPVPLFVSNRTQAVLLTSGDRVRFHSVDIEQHDKIIKQIETGAITIDDFRAKVVSS